ncbi:MAG: hypothetical protein ACR2FN_05125 [Chitinophagaceae bacterium]
MKNFFFFILLVITSCGNAQNPNLNATQNSGSNASYNKSAKGPAINLKSYGAKGLGISSIKEDTTALRNAIAFLNKNGGGRLYVPDPPKFYAFAGDGIFVGDNIEIYGDGKGKSEIRNVAPTSGKFLRGPTFLFSTYGSSNDLNIFQQGIEQYAIQDAKKGDAVAVLADKSNTKNLYVGEVVVLGAGQIIKRATDVKNIGRFHFMELNEISAIKGNNVYFTYPFSVQLPTFNGQSPVIVNINNTKTVNPQLGIINKTSKNIYIHDLTLSQAQTDELHGTPLDENLKNGLSGVWQPGGAFNSTFKNIQINSFSGLGGNMFTRCRFSNMDVRAAKKLIDFGYGGSNDTVTDVKWEYMKSPASQFASTFIICNDGTHNILMYNINCSGDWNGESLMLLSQTKEVTMHDIVLDFPNYQKNNTAIQIGDKEGVYSRDINLYNIQITVNTIGQFLRIGGENNVTDPNRNINISDITFKGNIATGNQNFSASDEITNQKRAATKAMKANNKSSKDQSVFIRNINGVNLKNVSIPSGEIYLENCNNSNFETINAPSSTLMVAGSNSNCKFNDVKVLQKQTEAQPVRNKNSF